MKLKTTFQSHLWSDGDETPAIFEWKKLNKRERMENQKAIEDFEKAEADKKDGDIEEKKKFLFELVFKRLLKVEGLFDAEGVEVTLERLKSLEFDNNVNDAIFASYMQGLTDDAASLKPKKESPPIG